MRRLLALPLLAILVAGPCALAADPVAQPAAPKAKPAAKVPLLDRELFFGNPELAAAQLSPDGQFIAFMKPWQGTRNVWVKKTGEPYSTARLVTAEPKRPVGGFFWSRDSRALLFVKDQDGDENFNVWAVDPKAAPEAGKPAPAARNLTAAKGARAQILGLPKHDSDLILVGLNDRDAAWHDAYQVRISTGERTLLRKNTERIAGWMFDRNGQLRLALRTTGTGATEILRVDPEGFVKIYECGVFESANPVGFHKDGKRVYLATNKGNRDLTQLVLLDLKTGAEALVEADPKGRVDFGGASFSEVTEELVATTYEDDRTRVYFKDKALEADYRLLEKKLPGREIALGGATADERLYMVTAYSDTDPGTRYLFDRKTKKLALEYVSREKLPRAHMAAMKAIRYPSSDGLEIPAYLTLPKGMAPQKLPLVVVPHGGPWARDGWGFNNLSQFLANRGYAVLHPNFRGSTGYGKAFLNAGNKQWGDLMQDDLTWGVKHLVKQGVADPERVAILGGSYGGYATLAGVTFTPSLYKAAVAIVAPSNLITLLETIPPYWEAGRIVFHERMGNPNTPEGRKQLERQSPLNHAGKITTPLMVVQGANDPRVKKAESEQIVIALRDRGYPVQYLCAPDEGHGFARPVNNMALMAATEAFLAKHLNGRVQTEMPAEVGQRLKEITVDPKTVVLAKKVDASAVTAPKPVAGLTAGTRKYAGTLAAGGQNLPMTLSQVTEAKDNTWVVSASATLAGQPMSDVTTYAQGTLAPLQRTVKQGPVTLEMAFAHGKASGSMSMGSAPKPFSADLGGDLFADGSGAHDSLACLPLAEGYRLVFRNFDVQKQKATLKEIAVMGQEAVTVPAGTFQAWKVEVRSAEGEPGTTLLWIDPATRKVVKTQATLPAMGGAVLTTELQ